MSYTRRMKNGKDLKICTIKAGTSRSGVICIEITVILQTTARILEMELRI